MCVKNKWIKPKDPPCLRGRQHERLTKVPAPPLCMLLVAGLAMGWQWTWSPLALGGRWFVLTTRRSVVGTRTCAAVVWKLPARNTRGKAATLIPRDTANPRGAWASRFQRIRGLAMNWRACHMEIEQLDVLCEPVHKLWSCCVLTKSLIINVPHAIVEVAVCPQNQQLVQCEVPPAVWEVRCEHQGENCKCFHPWSDILDTMAMLFWWHCQHEVAIQ